MNLDSMYIVIYNYVTNVDPTTVHDVPLLPLWIGEHLRILAEHGNWCYGHYESQPSHLGLFPKTHVREIAAPTDSRGSQVCEAQQLIDEITDTVKIWWRCVKNRYRDNDCSAESSEKFVKFIKDLMIIRNKLRSGNVPTGELKEIRLSIARKIDVGNHNMGLGMHIRNDLGKVIRAEELSVVNAYKQHELAHSKLVNESFEGSKYDRFSVLININSALEIKSCPYDAEFAMYLMNAKSGEAVSETLTLHWSRVAKRFAHDACRALFVDVTARELQDDNLRLVVVMSKLAPIEAVVNSPRAGKKFVPLPLNSLAQAAGRDTRQIYARGEINLFEQVRDIMDKEKREALLNLTKTNRNYHNSSNSLAANSASTPSSKPFPLFFSHKISQTISSNAGEVISPTSSGNTSSFDYKIPLAMTLQLIAGPLETIQDHNPDIFLSTNPPPPAILQRLQPIHSKQTLDFRRNEVYINLKSADLRIGKSSSSSSHSSSSSSAAADRNLEAVLSVWDADGNQLADSFEIITPEKVLHVNSIRSRVTVREERPHFDEMVKLILPAKAVRGLHLRILYYNRRSFYTEKEKGAAESGKKNSAGALASPDRTPIALSFLNLIQNFALVADGLEDVELLVYKIETVKFDERSVSYLRLNSKRVDFLLPRYSGTGSAVQPAGAAQTAYGPFTLAEKGVMILRHLAVSAFHTKSLRLLHIFRWRQIGATSEMLNDRIHDVIEGTNSSANVGVDEEFRAEQQTDELLKFLPSFLDALFQIAADEQMAAKSQRTVFDAVVYLIRLCDEPKNAQFASVLTDYVEKFSSAMSHEFLLENLTWYIENESQNSHRQQLQGSSRDQLLPILKSIGLLTQLIVASKHCYDSVQACSTSKESEVEHSSPPPLPDPQFCVKMDALLERLSLLMRAGTTARMTCQNAALKYFPAMVGPLLRYGVYEPAKLARYISALMDNLSEAIIVHQKLTFFTEIIDTEIFASKECRQLLLPKFLDQLLVFMTPHLWSVDNAGGTLAKGMELPALIRQRSLGGFNVESPYYSHNQQNHAVPAISAADSLATVELAARIITDLVEKLFPYSRSRSLFQHGTAEELRVILFKALRPVNQTVIVLLCDPTHQRALHTLLLALLDKFSAENFLSLRTSIDRLDMLSEMLHMFRDLLQRCPLPAEWYQMRHLQHKLFTKHIRFANALIVQQFGGTTLAHNINYRRPITASVHDVGGRSARMSKCTTVSSEDGNAVTNSLSSGSERKSGVLSGVLSTTALIGSSGVEIMGFVPEIWLESMLTAVAMVKSLMAVIKNSRHVMGIGTSPIGNCVDATTSLSMASAYEQSNRDMCTIAASTLRSLWFSLAATQKLRMTSQILGAVLEVALCEEEAVLREITIPIFYDMLETEHHHQMMVALSSAANSAGDEANIFAQSRQSQSQFSAANFGANDLALPLVSGISGAPLSEAESAPTLGGVVDSNHRLSECGGGAVAFRVAPSTVNSSGGGSADAARRSFADEFIAQLDPLLDANRGGAEFRASFHEMFSERCATRPEQGGVLVAELGGGVAQFIEKVDKLLELLLNYRQVRLNSDCIENGMFCTVQLIDFYQRIEQNALYVNYLYKLYDLHVLSGNCVEAALTLKKHANLLKWSDEALENYLVAKPQHKRFETHVKLKERIYIEMADLFDKGEHWEQAVEVLKELIPVYENLLFDFDELARLLKRLAELYVKITSTIRMEHNYFLVAFYGLRAPRYLAGRKFVFRGEKLEQWSSFKQRMLHNYYGFKFVESVEFDCEAELANADGKFVQIIPVTAQPSAAYSLLNKSPSRLARWYYKHHQVQRFEQLRRETRPDTKWTRMDANDATRLWLKRRYVSIAKPLPDILKFAEVVGELEPEPANPVEVAALKIEEVNEQLAETAQLVAAGFVQFLVNLGGAVRGVVQADVGGGIRNYEAFFSDACWRDAMEAERRAISLLKTLLREHVTILEYALYVHASKHAQINDAFHNSLVEIFAGYRRNIETRFGAVKSILPPGATIYLSSAAPPVVPTLGAAGASSTQNSTSDLTGGGTNSAAQSPMHHHSNSNNNVSSASLAGNNGDQRVHHQHNSNHSTTHNNIHHYSGFTNNADDVDSSTLKSGSLQLISLGLTPPPMSSSSSLSVTAAGVVCPTGSSSSSLGGSGNVLFRHVPGAATLLRTTMSRSRTTTANSINGVNNSSNNMCLNGGSGGGISEKSSPSHTPPCVVKKQSLRALGRMMSGGGSALDNLHGPDWSADAAIDADENEQQLKAQNLAMISALREVSAQRFSSDSMLDLMSTGFAACANSVGNTADGTMVRNSRTSDNSLMGEASPRVLGPPLPPRISTIHSPELIRKH